MPWCHAYTFGALITHTHITASTIIVITVEKISNLNFKGMLKFLKQKTYRNRFFIIFFIFFHFFFLVFCHFVCYHRCMWAWITFIHRQIYYLFCNCFIVCQPFLYKCNKKKQSIICFFCNMWQLLTHKKNWNYAKSTSAKSWSICCWRNTLETGTTLEESVRICNTNGDPSHNLPCNCPYSGNCPLYLPAIVYDI